MKERPILFSAPMVRALLADTKTQTRRAVKPQPPMLQHPATFTSFSIGGHDYSCPYGQPGDKLWVKETWKADQVWDDFRPTNIPRGEPILCAADDHSTGIVPFAWGRGRPSIFMRRWMSRITLEIVSVRVERLNGISRSDAMQEGCPFPNVADGKDPRRWYADLWESINGTGSWAANPWVWVLEFKRVEVRS